MAQRLWLWKAPFESSRESPQSGKSTAVNALNSQYLSTKQAKLGHWLGLPLALLRTGEEAETIQNGLSGAK